MLSGSELSWVEDDFADQVGPAVVGGSFDFGFDDADLADGEFGGGHGDPFAAGDESRLERWEAYEVTLCIEVSSMAGGLKPAPTKT